MSENEMPPPGDVWPDLERTETLLRALAHGDDDQIRLLRHSGGDFWNVAWTLALLLRDVHNHDETALALIEDFLGPPAGRRR